MVFVVKNDMESQSLLKDQNHHGSVVVSETVNVGKKVAYDPRSETPMCILDAAMSSGDSSETDDSLRDSSTDEFVSYDQHDELAGQLLQRQQRSSFV